MSDRKYLNIEYKNILVSEIENGNGLSVGLIRLNRPKAMNALNVPTMEEVVTTFENFDNDREIGCIVITGNDKAFAAGADIKEMAEETTIGMLLKDQFARWDRIRKIKKPIIAAVSGYALGGGCELTMTCDMIIAAESATFGQPEINLAVMPGAGGTQRLTKAIGKARAMEIILTGRMVSAQEMYEAGLLTKVVHNEIYLEEAIALAKDIASKPAIAVQLAKESILNSMDTTIETGLELERKNFYMLFATEDKFEGMNAFIEKRRSDWKHK
ncbi:enoyl-CoA hydratase [Ignavibacteria bacterium CHB1]|nr:MAG: enoyl-CoA hydratase [Chlorobiota bacterium]MBV6399345.1 putative enoyl-CoA hydratase echA8 [Ignavibacteria bacterium]MCC6886790.1 enoyl-CoA hydratase/isomerase family protein [Ignavibacteriales bacterium]MCE7953727.1 enoyl-CoA hydratase [Chlorobi bacterium CHB7]MDL1887661.1 enoyl-CoA hydratase [Ignavibacteria bacterium CHB1]RIK48168.1 MAG: enoyl-CoA hydratase [Ignavibacteriota bacterium]